MTNPISQVDALTIELADAQATIARLERELADARDPASRSMAHSEGCWCWRHHHECAIARVERLKRLSGRLQRALDAAGIVRGGDSLSAREILAAAEKLAQVPVPADSLPQAVVMRD